MNNDSAQLEALFEQALKCATPESRAAFLADACRGQPELRVRLDLLLEGHFMAQGFLAGAEDTRRPPGEEPVGTMIGRYKLLDKIGEGGFGIVYQAEQREPVKRRVALKIIKPGMDSRQVIGRFEAERQALALMDHPGIARVFDGGETASGRPYFVMELVCGVPITAYCDEQQLSTEERLRVFMNVCEAVQHAHQKGIIHRDLKPSNILVTIADGRAVPKVIDFGVAKATQQELTEKTVFTQFHHFIGTPAYVSPEQAQLTSQDIDTRSDIYALGVLLYELLTGKTPFDGKELLALGLDEMRRTIREVEPVKPSTRLTRERLAACSGAFAKSKIENRKSEIDKDLDWIVMKCLEKDRSRRYETANGLATDIAHHLSNEPIVARPPSRLYRFRKSVQRNKLAFGAATAVALALVIGLAVSTAMYFKAEAEKKNAQAEKKKTETEAAKNAQTAQFLMDMLGGIDLATTKGRDTVLLSEILNKAAGRVGADLSRQPEVEAELCETIGTVYYQIGPVEKAEAMQRRALTIRRALPGDHRPEVARSLSRLGLTLWREEKLSEAAIVLRESLTIQTNLPRADDLLRMETLVWLGAVLTSQGSLPESEGMIRRALQLSTNIPGQGDWKLAWPLRHLGQAVEAEGKLAEAEQLLREAVSADRKAVGDEHFWTAESLRFLGTTLRRAGKPNEAESTLREAMSVFRKVTDQQKNLHLAWTLDELASVLTKQGRLAGAEDLLRESLAIKGGVLGDQHSDTTGTLSSLIHLLREQGKQAEANALSAGQTNAPQETKEAH